MNLEPALPAEPLFAASMFAARVRLAVHRAGSLRKAAAESGVSLSTLQRAANGWPELSHENYLRLSAWMAGLKTEIAA